MKGKRTPLWNDPKVWTQKRRALAKQVEERLIVGYDSQFMMGDE
jgi:hypothetical protein|tara:strand:- start:3665 stop:3796 length:132 start_codon:yes stop_codon:yes gene_type:complete